MDYSVYFEKAKNAQQVLVDLTEEKTNQVLLAIADALVEQLDYLLAANQKDLERMEEHDPKYDRLLLNDSRIKAIATDLKAVASLESPIGQLIEERELENGLNLKKKRVGLGVVGIIYEARPNVTVDVFALCFKTQNVTVLKGGREADYSNKAIFEVIQNVLHKHGISPDVVVLLPAERTATEALLHAVGSVDVLIPRGSQQLIQYVRAESKIPVIETGAGIVHTYFDRSGNLQKGAAIVANAKIRKVSACNSLDCLLIHRDRISDLPELAKTLADNEVMLYADEEAYAILRQTYPAVLLQPAAETHFGTEFLSLKLAIKTVGGLQEAVQHITQYGSKHSEAIIADDVDTSEAFMKKVDAAAVYVNASPAFTDGAQFGLGAEIGISTQKLHARGPMGLVELTSYKWLITGDGQIRS